MDVNIMSSFQTCRGCLPTRVVIAVTMFFMLACSSMQGYGVEAFLKGMVKFQNISVNQSRFCANHQKVNNSPLYSNISLELAPKYDWSRNVQKNIISSYWLGYCSTQIAGGLLSEKYGMKKVVVYSQLCSTCLSFFVPLAAGCHYYFLITLRFITGFFGGFLWPAIHVAISHWSPPTEKSKFVCASTGGIYGVVFIFPIINKIYAAVGWQVSLYCISLINLFMFILWILLVYDSPSSHPSISSAEKDYINRSIGPLVERYKVNSIPWRAILTSPHVSSLILLHFAFMWSLNLQLSYIFHFVSDVLDIKQNGGCAWLYILPLATSIASCITSDYVLNYNLISADRFRKLTTVTSHAIPGIMLTLVVLLDSRPHIVVLLFLLSLCASGAATSGLMSNPHDLAPNYAGSIFGIMNTFGSTTSFLIHCVVNYITSNKNGIHEWQIIWGMTAILNFLAASIYFLGGSGALQTWNTAHNYAFPEAKQEDEIEAISEPL